MKRTRRTVQWVGSMAVAIMVLGAASFALGAQQSKSVGVVQLTTTDGWVIKGTVSSGIVLITTSFGEVKVEGRRIKALSGGSFTLDDGSVLRGTIIGGDIKLASAYGNLTVPGEVLETITTLTQSQATSTVAPPPVAEPVKEETPPPATEKPVQTSVRFVNRTSNVVRLYLDESPTYDEIGPRETLTKELTVGSHRLQGKALKLLGPVVIELGILDKTVTIEVDAVVELEDGDFR